jgi:hypothetical protein
MVSSLRAKTTIPSTFIRAAITVGVARLRVGSAALNRGIGWRQNRGERRCKDWSRGSGRGSGWNRNRGRGRNWWSGRIIKGGDGASNCASVEHKVGGPPSCPHHDTTRCVSTDSRCDLRRSEGGVLLEEQGSDTRNMRRSHGCSAYCPNIVLQVIKRSDVNARRKNVNT